MKHNAADIFLSLVFQSGLADVVMTTKITICRKESNKTHSLMKLLKSGTSRGVLLMCVLW